jgi:FkbM family methyltransferase
LVRRGLRSRVVVATEHLPLLRSLAYRTVIDVGANRGQFALAALIARPESRLIALEPLKEAADVFESVFAGTDTARLLRVAAGSSAGSAQLWVTAADDSSSLLRPTSDQVQTFPGTEVVSSRIVDTAPLSEVLNPADLVRPVLLKLDVQGSELDALLGAGSVLESVDFVLVEASFRQFYAGQPSAHDIVVAASDLGFRLRSAHQPSVTSAGEVLQLDLFFQRAHD